MAFRRWFGDSASSSAKDQELTIEDLIVLERYEEAEARLKAKLKANAADLRSHLKLADVYTASKRFDLAVEELVFVAGSYAQDGFFDKAVALVAKAQKLRPLDDGLQRRAESLERGKRLEQSRVAAMEGLRTGIHAEAHRQRAAVELQQIWQNLSGCSLVRRLPSEQLKRLFAVMELIRVEPGNILATRGSTLPQMALVGRGMIEAVVPKTGGGETVIRNFTTGDLIGEGALLEHRAWPATYRVSETAMLLTLSREGLEQALLGNPDPRMLLDALREQHLDRMVALSLHQMGISS